MYTVEDYTLWHIVCIRDLSNSHEQLVEDISGMSVYVCWDFSDLRHYYYFLLTFCHHTYRVAISFWLLL